MKKRRPLIVYLQFTNPAGYPPLEHSSRILAANGFDVVLLGVAAVGSDPLQLEPHASIKQIRLPGFGDKRRLYVNYLFYTIASVLYCMWRRPKWLYASESQACLPALLAAALSSARVIYHEHDAPALAATRSVPQRCLHAARRRLSLAADLCILPQAARLEAFVVETRRRGPSLCVWNCPRRSEVGPGRTADAPGEPTRFFYHGSLNGDRLSMSILDALSAASDTATLVVVGYETAGSQGYMQSFMARATELGLARRVRYLGPKNRSVSLIEARRASVGLALVKPCSDDINLARMTGASNKPFDYLSQGLALLVSKSPKWVEMYVEPGFANSCDPLDVADIARAMRWCVQNPRRVSAMGERGRRRILSDWNCEQRFAEAMRFIEGSRRP